MPPRGSDCAVDQVAATSARTHSQSQGGSLTASPTVTSPDRYQSTTVANPDQEDGSQATEVRIAAMPPNGTRDFVPLDFSELLPLGARPSLIESMYITETYLFPFSASYALCCPPRPVLLTLWSTFQNHISQLPETTSIHSRHLSLAVHDDQELINYHEHIMDEGGYDRLFDIQTGLFERLVHVFGGDVEVELDGRLAMLFEGLVRREVERERFARRINGMEDGVGRLNQIDGHSKVVGEGGPGWDVRFRMVQIQGSVRSASVAGTTTLVASTARLLPPPYPPAAASPSVAIPRISTPSVAKQGAFRFRPHASSSPGAKALSIVLLDACTALSITAPPPTFRDGVYTGPGFGISSETGIENKEGMSVVSLTASHLRLRAGDYTSNTVTTAEFIAMIPPTRLQGTAPIRGDMLDVYHLPISQITATRPSGTATGTAAGTNTLTPGLSDILLPLPPCSGVIIISPRSSTGTRATTTNTTTNTESEEYDYDILHADAPPATVFTIDVLPRRTIILVTIPEQMPPGIDPVGIEGEPKRFVIEGGMHHEDDGRRAEDLPPRYDIRWRWDRPGYEDVMEELEEEVAARRSLRTRRGRSTRVVPTLRRENAILGTNTAQDGYVTLAGSSARTRHRPSAAIDYANAQQESGLVEQQHEDPAAVVRDILSTRRSRLRLLRDHHLGLGNLRAALVGAARSLIASSGIAEGSVATTGAGASAQYSPTSAAAVNVDAGEAIGTRTSFDSDILGTTDISQPGEVNGALVAGMNLHRSDSPTVTTNSVVSSNSDVTPTASTSTAGLSTSNTASSISPPAITRTTTLTQTASTASVATPTAPTQPTPHQPISLYEELRRARERTITLERLEALSSSTNTPATSSRSLPPSKQSSPTSSPPSSTVINSDGLEDATNAPTDWAIDDLPGVPLEPGFNSNSPHKHTQAAQQTSDDENPVQSHRAPGRSISISALRDTVMRKGLRLGQLARSARGVATGSTAPPPSATLPSPITSIVNATTALHTGELGRVQLGGPAPAGTDQVSG